MPPRPRNRTASPCRRGSLDGLRTGPARFIRRPPPTGTCPAGASPSGKAPDFDSGTRRFDPSRPSHPARTPTVLRQVVKSRGDFGSLATGMAARDFSCGLYRLWVANLSGRSPPGPTEFPRRIWTYSPSTVRKNGGGIRCNREYSSKPLSRRRQS